MFLHCLRPAVSWQDCAMFQKFHPFYAKSDPNLRTQAFSDLVSANILFPSPGNDRKEFMHCPVKVIHPFSHQLIDHETKTTPNIVQTTMLFPYLLQNTIMYRPQLSVELNNKVTTLRTIFTQVSKKLTPFVPLHFPFSETRLILLISFFLYCSSMNQLMQKLQMQ
jgi:hypothetical protein